MKTFLKLSGAGNRFEVYSDTFCHGVSLEYVGYIQRCKNIWTCYPEKQIQDITETIKSEVDEILRLLNLN